MFGRETCGLLFLGHMGVFKVVTAFASLSSRGIFELMAGTGGQLVSVSIPTVEGGTPTYSAVVVAEPDPKKAEQLVRESAAYNEEVEAIGPVPESVVKLFELKAGQFTPWRQEPNETEQPSAAPKMKKKKKKKRKKGARAAVTMPAASPSEASEAPVGLAPHG
jgi:hypothetical protein